MSGAGLTEDEHTCPRCGYMGPAVIDAELGLCPECDATMCELPA